MNPIGEFWGDEYLDDVCVTNKRTYDKFADKDVSKMNTLIAINRVIKNIRTVVDDFVEGKSEFNKNKTHMENILKCVEKISKKEIKYIRNKFHISSRQAIILSCIIDCRFERNRVYLNSLASYFSVPNIVFLTCNEDLMSLCRERIIFYDTMNTNIYCNQIIDLVLNDKEYVKPDYSSLSEGAIIEQIRAIYMNGRNNSLPKFSAKMWIDEVMETANQDYGFIKYFNKVKEKLVTSEDYYALLFLCSNCHKCENWFSESSLLVGLYPLFGNDEDSMRNYIEDFVSCKTLLWESRMVDYVNENGTIHKDSYCIKKDVLDEAYTSEPILYSASENMAYKGGSLKNIINPDDIISKEMFYNIAEEEKVSKLESILQDENFSHVVERLKEQGMRCGFTCMFYGPPGTGKTETALQLARKTGRKIFSINVSDLKSMWVGESEKLVKQLFVDYNKLVNDEKEKTPILFFNEADAIFGKRNTNAEYAVDKMENSIQNIILDEMDKFEGILIATTNITNLFDKAFERRFLYKIYFDKPCEDAKSKIWKTMIPELSEANARLISRKYDFSGGQIENIARKAKIDYILDGEKVTIDKIDTYCSDEKIGNTGGSSIGFRTQL